MKKVKFDSLPGRRYDRKEVRGLKRDNYVIQMEQAKMRFLTYDQDKILRKLGTKDQGDYIYVNLLCKQYRIHRKTADVQRWEHGWVDGNSYNEVMTLLDLVCDSREDRKIAGVFQSMESFGLMFHQNLLQDRKDPLARKMDENPELFSDACRKLGGFSFPGGDLGYCFPVFEDLSMVVLFWHSDEEFAPRIRYLWDANALQYLRYETMYFALGAWRHFLLAEMENAL